MNFSFWYDVAEYGNVSWNGGFTPREIAENAYEYMIEYVATINSVDGKVTPAIDTLMHLLHADYCSGNIEALNLLNVIVDGLINNGIEWYID